MCHRKNYIGSRLFCQELRIRFALLVIRQAHAAISMGIVKGQIRAKQKHRKSAKERTFDKKAAWEKIK